MKWFWLLLIFVFATGCVVVHDYRPRRYNGTMTVPYPGNIHYHRGHRHGDYRPPSPRKPPPKKRPASPPAKKNQKKPGKKTGKTRR